MAHLWTKQKQYFDLSRNKNTNIVKKNKKKNIKIYIYGEKWNETKTGGKQNWKYIYCTVCVLALGLTCK